MNIIHTKDYNNMSRKAAQYLLDKIKHKPDMTLGLATGGTPVKFYDYLVRDHQQQDTSYKNITTFNLDEYIGLDPKDTNSYHYYMNKHLFQQIDIPQEQTFIPNGLADNLLEECRQYEQTIDHHGGMDLQILGLGGNGHIGFNEPGTSFNQETHIVELAESTRQANARFFQDLNKVPTQAITMGIASIMKSKEILLLVSGEQKKEALHLLINGEVSTEFPASILKKHPHVTIIADEKALADIHSSYYA
ncbi:glucosamine-6-phosphate deaminase [Gracilibacillus sp. YIM 98692]|uniref:glucosamine-6-phosphate deaminase n=1 Tax=Gracilibacillus sp. YIM 98692 TaxID=2663532 RepID=UPI0013D837F7|nr:glucosamine-6-phosphate deaminase [Gracilibacillus sp. YIM 98692]